MRQTPDFALIISPAGTSPQMFRRRKQCYGFAPSSLKSEGVCIKKSRNFCSFVSSCHGEKLKAEGYDMVTFKKVRDDL